MNIIRKLFEKYAVWIEGWAPSHVGFFVQAILLFGLPTAFCVIAFRWGSRSVFVQTLAFVSGVLVAVSIPVERCIPRQPTGKAWLVTICFVLLVFLPAMLPRVLTPELGKQRKLQAALYIAVAGLFLINLFSS